MIVVADASVALKWFFRGRKGEAHTQPALDLLRGVRDGIVTLWQPPHFVAEVAAVLAREAPATARRDLDDLLQIEMQVHETREAYARAVHLATRYRQHVFDTLYHAVALQTKGALLVSADDRYVRAAGTAGRVMRLAEFRVGEAKV